MAVQSYGSEAPTPKTPWTIESFALGASQRRPPSSSPPSALTAQQSRSTPSPSVPSPSAVPSLLSDQGSATADSSPEVETLSRFASAPGVHVEVTGSLTSPIFDLNSILDAQSVIKFIEADMRKLESDSDKSWEEGSRTFRLSDEVFEAVVEQTEWLGSLYGNASVVGWKGEDGMWFFGVRVVPLPGAVHTTAADGLQDLFENTVSEALPHLTGAAWRASRFHLNGGWSIPVLLNGRSTRWGPDAGLGFLGLELVIIFDVAKSQDFDVALLKIEGYLATPPFHRVHNAKACTVRRVILFNIDGEEDTHRFPKIQVRTFDRAGEGHGQGSIPVPDSSFDWTPASGLDALPTITISTDLFFLGGEEVVPPTLQPLQGVGDLILDLRDVVTKTYAAWRAEHNFLPVDRPLTNLPMPAY